MTLYQSINITFSVFGVSGESRDNKWEVDIQYMHNLLASIATWLKPTQQSAELRTSWGVAHFCHACCNLAMTMTTYLGLTIDTGMTTSGCVSHVAPLDHGWTEITDASSVSLTRLILVNHLGHTSRQCCRPGGETQCRTHLELLSVE